MVSQTALLSTLNYLTVPIPVMQDFGIESVLAPGEPETVARSRNLVDQDNVVAVGISQKVSDDTDAGPLAVTFYVEKKKPLSQLKGAELIPKQIAVDAKGQSIPTDVVAIGLPKLEAPPWVKRDPIEPGNSIGHFATSAGTLGALVRKGRTIYLLSNSHVLAQSGTGAKGDKILFPGNIDGGIEDDDVIAALEDFVAFTIGGEMVNHTDCAIAIPLPEHLAKVVSEIRDIGLPTGTKKARRGMIVTKSGRTTQVTEATVKDVNFRMTINYPGGVGKVGFLDQVFCTRYTEGGDSGSLVLEKGSNKAVGLHFAGYPDKHGIKGSVFNPIQKVLSSLKVKLVTKPIASG